MKFTQADKEFFAAVRQEKPEVDHLFKDLRSLMTQFPGSSITYLKIGEFEWGEKSPEGVVPCLTTIPNSTKQNQKVLNRNARRRLITRYAGDMHGPK